MAQGKGEVMAFEIPQVVQHKDTGDLLVTKNVVKDGYYCSKIDRSNVSSWYKATDLKEAPPRKPGSFDYRTEIIPRAQGQLPWGWIEPADFVNTLSNISACGGWTAYPDIAWVTKPGETRSTWARLFLHITQGGGYTGEAHALVYETQRGAHPSLPSTWLLSICKHDVVDTSTPEGRVRGWHPAHCSKCGINLSVDCSD